VLVLFRFYYKTRTLRRKLTASDFFLALTVLLELCNRAVGTELLAKKLGLSSTDVATKSHAYTHWDRQNLKVSYFSFLWSCVNRKLRFLVSQFDWFQSIMWTVEVYSIKYSFIFGYFSLSACLPRRFFWALLVLAVYCLLGGILVPIFIALVWCRPITDNWNPAAHCSSLQDKSLYINSMTHHIFSDAMVIGFGLAIVMQLSCPRKEMLGAAVIAGLGLISIAISITRVVLVWTERFLDGMLFCSVEVSSGVIAACLPAFKAYLRSAWTPKEWGSPEEKRGPSGSTQWTPGYLGADKLEPAGTIKPEFSAMVVREDLDVESGLQRMQPTVSL
jgi:hypothetical protein